MIQSFPLRVKFFVRLAGFFILAFYGLSMVTEEAIASKSSGLSQSDTHNYEHLFCLAMNIYHEARGETDDGQQAIAMVTMNRVRSDYFPDTVCQVVWQHKQFSWTQFSQTHHIIKDLSSWRKALMLAKQAINGDLVSNVGEATHYHADYVQPYWAKSSRLIAKVGNHAFYEID